MRNMNKDHLGSNIPEFTLGQMNFPNGKPVKVQPNYSRYHTLNPEEISVKKEVKEKSQSGEKFKKLFNTVEQESTKDLSENPKLL